MDLGRAYTWISSHPPKKDGTSSPAGASASR
jgi:hypothetical protein